MVRPHTRSGGESENQTEINPPVQSTVLHSTNRYWHSTVDILSVTGVLYLPRPTLFELSSQTLINCFSAHHIKIHKAATKNYFILINHWKIISYSMEIKYLGIFKIICCSFCVRRKKHFALNKIHLRRFILIESPTIKIFSQAPGVDASQERQCRQYIQLELL